MPFTASMYRFLAPLLSAQFMTAATFRPRDMRSLPPPLPPRPRFIVAGPREERGAWRVGLGAGAGGVRGLTHP